MPKDTPKKRKRLINIIDEKESPMQKIMKNDSDCMTKSTTVIHNESSDFEDI